MTRVFQVFYFIINFGSFFSTILTPLLYGWFGPEVAFGVPGVFMGIATLVFWMGRKRFVHVKPNPGGKLGAMDFTASVLLFSPVLALIVTVFIEGGHFKPEPIGNMGKLEFYAGYLADYSGHLASASGPYVLTALVLFGLGFLLFNMRQNKQPDNGFLAVTLYAFKNRRRREKGQGFYDVARETFGADAAAGPPAVLRIMLVFSGVSVFWALFDQHASTWIEQARQMDRLLSVPRYLSVYLVVGTIGLALFGGTWLLLWVSNASIPRRVTKLVLGLIAGAGVATGLADLINGEWVEIELEAAQISALNPLMVMMIIPGLNVLVYHPLKERGIEVRPLQKMTVGMFMAAVAFGTGALLQARIEDLAATGGAEVHVLWQVVQYLIMTTAEVLVSVTGLEFAYTQAPRAMKSTIMGFWLLCVTFGNVLVAFVAPMQTILSLSQFFWVFTGLMTVAAAVFAVMAKLYKGQTYLQQANA